ncbi:RING-H2 finger protein [Facilibium subflavum]|uniref:RING-H2 finger protein n=1 Tax=Facilibium subflavum TaxID=2219058 RepID=UPI000E649E35|nr:RING-H2 finger protein [Facilibium subflavum]
MPAYKIVAPNNEINNEICVICQEDLINQRQQHENGSICKTICSHYYHKNCIDTWLNQSETCPLCNTRFGERRQRPEANFDIHAFIADEQARLPQRQIHQAQPQRQIRQAPVNLIEPSYRIALNENLGENRIAFFQNLVDQAMASQLVSLDILKTAINNATNAYLNWRGNGRGFFHRGNTGRDRASNFRQEIQNFNGSVNDCWRQVCNTIRNFPRHNHSYTSFILNELKQLPGLGIRNIDYTSDNRDIRNERFRLLDGGLIQIPIEQQISDRRLKASFFGTIERTRQFWQYCFNRNPQFAGMGMDHETVNLHRNTNLQVWCTAGQDRLRTITSAYYRNANILIIAGNAAELRNFSSRIQGNENTPVVWVEMSLDD